MPRIKVDPAQLRALSAQLQQIADDLQGIGGYIGNVIGGLDWEVRQKAGVEGQANDARSRANALAGQAEAMARYLATKAQAFEEADQQGVIDLDDIIRRYPIPVPAPTPVPEPGGMESAPDTIRQVVERLDDLLKPIDWVTDHAGAAKKFRTILRELGRLLNALTGKRGHIKLLMEMGDVLTGTAKTVSVASDLYTLGDFKRYFAGELTNQEIARTAIKALIPIPFLDTRIANWLTQSVPDPNGRWRGLIRGAE